MPRAAACLGDAVQSDWTACGTGGMGSGRRIGGLAEMELIFLLAAVICFGAGALDFGQVWRIGLLPAGLFFWALSALWPHLGLGLH